MVSKVGTANPGRLSRRRIAFGVALLAAVVLAIALIAIAKYRPGVPAPTSMPNRDDLNRSLLAAIRDGDHTTVGALLDQGADVNARNGLRDTALMQAALNSDRAMMQLLLQRGADVHTRGVYDVTALLRALHDPSRLRR
jgi:hypothetical protein